MFSEGNNLHTCFAMGSSTYFDILAFAFPSFIVLVNFFLSFPLSLVSLSDGFQVRVSTTQYKLAERYNFTSPMFAELETKVLKGIEFVFLLLLLNSNPCTFLWFGISHLKP